MHAALSNDVAEEMTNAAAAVFSTYHCGDSVTLYVRAGHGKGLSTSDAVISISYPSTSIFRSISVSPLQKS
jgi:hypothetical protein